MTTNTEAPVVLGTGVNGLMASVMLSRAGIEHVLLGPDPDPLAPRLGESLDIVGSHEFSVEFPMLSRHFHQKDGIFVCGRGRYFYLFDFVRLFSFWGFRLVAHTIMGLARGLPYALHVERHGFDQDLYELAVSASTARRMRGRVCGFERDGDRVLALNLEDGTRLPTPVVIDATGQARVLGRLMGIAERPIGPELRTVFSLRAGPEAGADKANPQVWRRASHLITLDAERDGADGIGWCLPLGDRVSIGLSVDRRPEDEAGGGPGRDELLGRLMRAFARVGVPVADTWPDVIRANEIRHHYFVCERVYGENWLLAGPSGAEVHFASSAGLGLGLSAARLAPSFVRDPRVGARYERYVRQLVSGHNTLDALARSNSWDTRLGNRWFLESWLRIAAYCGVNSSTAHRSLAACLLWTWKNVGMPIALLRFQRFFRKGLSAEEARVAQSRRGDLFDGPSEAVAPVPGLP